MAQITLRDYLQTTEDAINSGRVNEALVNCQYILTHFPDLLEAQRLLGEIYLKQGHLAEAQHTFDWILTNDPENVVAYCSRALISEQQTDYDTALDCYQQAYELSRGISHIRQEFNQLSEKVGQAGFIFSRAGLARLYMRGDLLPQAIQEWEAVLTAAPERLDAQIGLLEALWREGFYDRVEQLAAQILQEVPGCLKALLLLAHVTLAQNAQQAQEIMQRARALDPDLVMAQELFSDYLVSHPKDPFVALLKNPPTMFPDTSNGKHTEPMLAGAATSNGTYDPSNSATFSDPLVRWSSLDNIMEPQQDYQPAQEASTFGNWASGTVASSDFEAWNKLEQQSGQAAPSAASQSTSLANDVEAASPWSTFAEPQPTQDAQAQTARQESITPVFEQWHATNLNTDALERHGTSAEAEPVQQEEHTTGDGVQLQEYSSTEQQQPWYHVDIFEEAAVEPWSSANSLEAAPAPWEIEEQEGTLPAPPAWLDMLTRDERRQPSGDLAQQTEMMPGTESEPRAFSMPSTDGQKAEAAPAGRGSGNDKAVPIEPSSNDEEPFFFGPEWLKSLGATAMESPSAVEAEPSAVADVLMPPPPIAMGQQAAFSSLNESEPQDAPVQTEEPEFASAAELAVVQEAETPVLSTAPATDQKPSVGSWLDQAARKLAQPDQNLLTTLEELENDLRARGFMPLEPGVLSALAQEPSLSAALAQFASNEQQLTTAAEPPSVPEQIAEPESTPTQTVQAAATSAEPLWSVAPAAAAQTPLQPVSSPAKEQVPVASVPSHLEALANFAGPSTQKPAIESVPDAAHLDAVAQLVTNTPASTSFSVPAAPAPVPVAQPIAAARPAFVLDAELETTMKRPTMQQRPGNQLPSKGRTGERSAASKVAQSNVSYKERLLKGYQYQLAGSYDDAMQEYRVIIRNAPELLGEVVSNMRALLKLAPKYSAGYRVLGDAYMRQGEYLQAMEAYNKALTMAKKAKS